jgi:uncharacterized membrane protein
MDFFNSVEFYNAVKFLHIAAAVCWVGGGVVLMYLGVLGSRAADEEAQLVVVRQTNLLATTWFIPASLSTVIFGIVAATLAGVWSHGWVVLGLVGFAATFATGNFVIKPTGERIARHESAGRRDLALAEGRKLTTVARFDYVMLFTVIFDMVFKPQWSDLTVLGVMAVAVAIGAVLFLVPALRMQPAAAA